jgi:hypothetical protein
MVTGFVHRCYSTKRLTNVERNSFFVSPDLHDIIIGLSLGDLFIRRESKNARLFFEQGVVNEDYLLHLYSLFGGYCQSEPKKSDRLPDKRTGKVYTRIQFITYSLPCFNYYHGLFYVDKVKTIPFNIGELITPIGLAYWAMDDGSKHDYGFILCTHSYSLSEVLLLIKVLKEKFDLNCTYPKNKKDQHRIYIKADSMDKFRSLVTPHFHSSMMYKLS